MKKIGSVFKIMLSVIIGLSIASSVWAGGTLRYATIGEPPTLDGQVTTSDLATTIAQHVFEGLYTFDSSYSPVPLLAAGETLSNGGKTIVISIRTGVTFHNGKSLTAKDVVASMNRWGEHGSRGKLLFKNVDSVVASGSHEVTLQLNAPFGPWKNILALLNGGLSIHPEEIMSKAGKKPLEVSDYIGTGPYKFVSWRPNRYIELVRFDGYSSRSEAADGYGGKREAKFDKIHFIPVPDAGTRVSGVRAGDYDYAENIPGDLFEELDNDPSVRVVLGGAPIFGLMFMNSKAGQLQSNYALRRAIRTALNQEEAAQVSIGPKKLWKLNHSFLPKGNTWWNEAGMDGYNVGDPAKAKELAQQAGYNGEPITLIVSTNYGFHYDHAVIYTRRLVEAGFKVDLKVFDWASLIKNRGIPENWDMFFTHHGFVPDPVMISLMNENYPGWWKSPEKVALAKEFVGTADEGKRIEIWKKIQALIYEQVPVVKTADIYTYNIASPKLKGISETSLVWPHFWGVEK
ncbi:MAG: ABC transporter substrate-binding protein [Desulfobulbaceae bacterium]|nr:ABC transporter substrate-binding protein [Desulfobulbaceae bacterium]